MKDFLEIYSGSTVDAGFVKKYLEENGVICYVENKHDATITANWSEIKSVIGSSVLVKSNDFEKAENLVKKYLNSSDS